MQLVKCQIPRDTEDVTMCHSVLAEKMKQSILTQFHLLFLKSTYVCMSRRIYSKVLTMVTLLDYGVALPPSRGMQLL